MKNCDCNPPAINSSIIGERCHVVNDRGEWCAIKNDSGVYLQNLVLPSEQEILKEQAHQELLLAEREAQLQITSRSRELTEKLKNGEVLTSQELSELLSLIL